MILVVGLFLLSVALLLVRLVWTFVLAARSSTAYRQAAPAPDGGLSMDQVNILIVELAETRKKQRWSSAMDVLFLGVSAAAGTAGSLLALNPDILK